MDHQDRPITPNKSRVPIILASIAVVMVLGIVAAFFLFGERLGLREGQVAVIRDASRWDDEDDDRVSMFARDRTLGGPIAVYEGELVQEADPAPEPAEPDPEPDPVPADDYEALPTPSPDIPDGPTMADEFRSVEMLQLSPLTRGEELVTMHTSLGDITLRFFPTEAPLAVENFLTHAWNGYYDGLIFHRVIPDFMIQGGCDAGTGRGGQSIWGGQFDCQHSPNLMHFRGALAMAHAGPNTNGSQFYIVQSTDVGHFRSELERLIEMQDEIFHEFEDGSLLTYGDIFPENAMRHLLEHGGTPFLDTFFSNAPHTVFGHVVEGMDVVDAIANAPRGMDDRPVEDVVIYGFTFLYY